MKYYQTVDQLDMNHFNVTATVISGEHIGEKAVFVDHELFWRSSENGFFSENEELADLADETGIIEVNGVKVFCEILSADKKLVICGGGHVS